MKQHAFLEAANCSTPRICCPPGGSPYTLVTYLLGQQPGACIGSFRTRRQSNWNLLEYRHLAREECDSSLKANLREKQRRILPLFVAKTANSTTRAMAKLFTIMDLRLKALWISNCLSIGHDHESLSYTSLKG